MFDVDRHVRVDVEFPPKLARFYTEHAKYKVAYGGRGGAKSWTIARMLLLLAAQKPMRILCARETMTSIGDSVYQLLVDQIANLHLEQFYKIEVDKIKGANGSVFRFAGIKRDINQIKSFEGIDVAWIEEAANVSARSWQVLIPTIRKSSSEIWISFNPDYETDATYQRFIVRKPEDAIVVKVDYFDNPWIDSETDLSKQIEESRLNDPPETFRHIWLGECRLYLDGCVYANEIRLAETNEGGSRFREVPYDPQGGEVCAAWDIGIGDYTAIWVFQRVGPEVHFIDYTEDRGLPAHTYVRRLHERGLHRNYVVTRHYLPHDAKARAFGTGLSTEEVLRKLTPEVRVIPRLSLKDGIDATRSLFHLFWFDAKNCADGLRAIRNYRFEISRRDGAGFKNEPVHDENSHGADAIRYAALSLRPPKIISEVKYDERWSFQRSAPTDWMYSY